ncbi:methyl-accepting chemotaxis protein [Haloarchaeobius amylolyticus]|uniref:methyl-accepting chemotaxis protein n=1 Tax=Haloarchaeobius amylolyticus TaxID=1198296 RepID=UPI00227180B9|nr:methyl-accepting chemotaxis protein [Haloarchaeobius amylolyticus]
MKFALALFSVLVIIGGVGGYIYLNTGTALQEDTSRELSTSAEMQAQFIDQTLRETRTAVQGLSTADAVQSEGGSDQITALMQSAASHEYVDSIYYVDTSSGEIQQQVGKGTGANGNSLTDAFTTRLDEMDSAAPGQVATSDPFSVEDSKVMVVRSDVPNQEGQSFVAVLDMQLLSVTALPQVSYGEVVVVDQSGTVMLSAERSQILQSDVISPDQLDGEDDFETLETSDGEKAVGFQELTTEDWTVTRRVPQSTAFALQENILTQLVTMLGLAFGSILLIGMTIGRNTVKSVANLSAKAGDIEEGDLQTQIETGRVDEIGQLYNSIDSMRGSLQEQIAAVQQARTEAEQAQAEAEQMNRHLERKADQYRDVMQACAAGDLTQRMDAQSESEAMADIANEFNRMVAELEETTDRVKAFASDVATASEEVTASSEEVRSASEQVTESVQEISDGAERQNQSLQSVNTEMDALSTTTEEIAASSNEVADLAERTAQTGRSGRDAAEDAIEGMSEIQDESAEAVDAIEELETEMEQIDELIEFISGLAKETNMLALNANIEASRGGGGEGDGDGFAVVAQQVKELAQDTKETAEDIEKRLETIQDQTDRTAEEVQRTSSRIAEHAGSVQAAVEALDEIAEYAQQTNDGVQEISAATEQQAASTEEVVAMVDEAATISEETTAEAENVAAAAEEQTTALTEVSNSASDLADQSARLSEALDRFETDTERVESESWGDAEAAMFEEAAEDEDFEAETLETPDPGDGPAADGDDDSFEFGDH